MRHLELLWSSLIGREDNHKHVIKYNMVDDVTYDLKGHKGRNVQSYLGTQMRIYGEQLDCKSMYFLGK